MHCSIEGQVVLMYLCVNVSSHGVWGIDGSIGSEFWWCGGKNYWRCCRCCPDALQPPSRWQECKEVMGGIGGGFPNMLYDSNILTVPSDQQTHSIRGLLLPGKKRRTHLLFLSLSSSSSLLVSSVVHLRTWSILHDIRGRDDEGGLWPEDEKKHNLTKWRKKQKPNPRL